ncbi:MAG: hypothetical protein DRO88_10065 [Promethearchaeia archaeon]|nr:MAG: hypothetical protein DRO88_10065 [Candidatus Lokiarchaeia archaeon]
MVITLGKPKTKENALEFKYINYNRIGAIFFIILLIFIGFFGFICNYYGEGPIDSSLIWYYQLFFKVTLSKNIFLLKSIPVLPLILTFTGYYLTNREELSLKGIKISLYFIPLTHLLSILWYWFNVSQINIEPIRLLFATWQGYLTIFLTIACILFGSFIGIKVKQYKLLKRKLILKKEV